MNSAASSLLCECSYSDQPKAEISAEDDKELRSQLPTQKPVEEIKELLSESNDEEVKEPKARRGRGRPRKYHKPEFYTGNIRLDVNDKNLIRAVRREFIEMFRVFCVDSGLYHYDNLSKDSLHLQKMKFEMPDDKFEEAMQSFIGHILEQDASEGDDPTTEELQSLKEFLIVFIDFTRDSSVMLPGTTRLLKNELQSLFYSYSHRKFGKFLEVPEMRFVMARVLNPEYIGTLISKNPTLNENEDLYRKCAEIILEKVDSHNGENEQQSEE